MPSIPPVHQIPLNRFPKTRKGHPSLVRTEHLHFELEFPYTNDCVHPFIIIEREYLTYTSNASSTQEEEDLESGVPPAPERLRLWDMVPFSSCDCVIGVRLWVS